MLETHEERISNLEEKNRKLENRLKYLQSKKPLLVIQVPTNKKNIYNIFKEELFNCESDLAEDYHIIMLYNNSTKEVTFEVYSIKPTNNVDVKKLKEIVEKHKEHVAQ